jgi:hypothetical protein
MSEDAESAPGHSSSQDVNQDMDDVIGTSSAEEDYADSDDSEDDVDAAATAAAGYARYREPGQVQLRAAAAPAANMDRLLGAAEQAFMQAIDRCVSKVL